MNRLTPLNPRLRAEVEAWIAEDPDAVDAAELTALLARADGSGNGALSAGTAAATAELADRFAGPLAFGTAGLRGQLRAGPNGMNTAVVRRTAAGLAAYLSASGRRPGSLVLVGYDARHRSLSFAQDSAAVFAAAGFDARLLPRALPTPVLAFAVRNLGAAAGVMVTASHNPRQDNGYKVYAADGAQIAPPTDRDIEARIRAAMSTPVELSSDYTTLDESIVDDYMAAIAGLVQSGSPRAIDIVYTALHGVGASLVRAVFASAGFAAPREVPEQAEPDPDFPTVEFPNPEEPGAMDLALALAARHEADLVLANDPDADRCAVGVRAADGWRMLTGDEVGVLLADWLLSHDVPGTYATTIASSTMLSAMLSAMTATHGLRQRVQYAETLTGFKWLARAADDLAYGYEEALGYAVAPQLVRDKDGISAALMVAEIAASLKADNSSIPRRLAELAGEYGQYATSQLSWRVSDPALIADAMGRIRAAPPATLLGRPVAVQDFALDNGMSSGNDIAPDSDVIVLRFDGGRVVVRPSGTEPKCKAYLEVVVASGSEAAAAAGLAALSTQVSELLSL